MACMCGDTHCSSCGPAQGNWRCIICNSWADDCCEHIDEEKGVYKKEFLPEVERLYKQEADAITQELEEDEDTWR